MARITDDTILNVRVAVVEYRATPRADTLPQWIGQKFRCSPLRAARLLKAADTGKTTADLVTQTRRANAAARRGGWR